MTGQNHNVDVGALVEGEGSAGPRVRVEAEFKNGRLVLRVEVGAKNRTDGTERTDNAETETIPTPTERLKAKKFP